MADRKNSVPQCFTLGIPLLFSLILVNPAFSYIWPNCQVTCNPGSLVSHAFLYVPPANTYTIKQNCTMTCVSWVSPLTVTYEGLWSPSDKNARKKITLEKFQHGSSNKKNTYVAKVTAPCPDDPWMKTVNCSVGSRTGAPYIFRFLEYPANYPARAGSFLRGINST
jgi:hypothetical protein